MNLEKGIIIKINNEIFLIVDNTKYLNLSLYYIQEDFKDENENILYSVIKDYNNETLYIYENETYLIPFNRLVDIPLGHFNYNLISNKIHNIKIIYENNII